MNFLPWSIQHAFAGLWPLVWHWGTPTAVIILAGIGELALGFFSSYIPLAEPAIRKLQEVLLAVMIAGGMFLWGLGDGVKVEHARAVAQQKVLLNQVGAVVDDVLKSPDVQPQPVTRVKKGLFRNKVIKRAAPRDRWDSPEN